MANLEGKSKTATEDRVKTSGEVFTPDSIVNEMLDETDRKLSEYFGVKSIEEISDDDYISYIILEPTCGSGNFLIRELDRKLERVTKYKGKEQEIALLKAVSSIYGIDITAENIVMSKLRMMEVIETGKTEVIELKHKQESEFRTSGFLLTPELRLCIQYILDKNIQCGNCLTCEKFLTWKSDYVKSIWDLNKQQLSFTDALIRTDKVCGELKLTQYDFENELVAIRERTYKNMHESTELYSNTSKYVEYNKIYTLQTNEIYKINNNNTDILDDYDF